MSVSTKRELIQPDGPLSIEVQCALLDLPRSSYYYVPCGESAQNLMLMKRIDRIYLRKPYFGRRRMCHQLRKEGYEVNPKRVARLMRLMGIEAIYPRPRTTQTHKAHRKYPYLLRNLEIDWPNQVWCSDITYIPMSQGFLYLVAVMDWFSRYVISWRISNSLESSFCLEALQEALSLGHPQIFNSDKGSQYTSERFTGLLIDQQIQISMTAQGCWDNLMVERLWRTLKYEHIYLHSYADGLALHKGLGIFFDQYNRENPHSALGMKTPLELWK
ncbi:MAG: IS3 family transposase [Bacteroidota bacterium]